MHLSIFFFLLLWAQALTLKNLNYSVPEEQGPGTVIGNIAKDARLGLEQIGQGGQGKKANFRVLENSAPHLIDVDPQSGLLYTKQRIDRETLCKRNPKCQLSMEVFANDKEICMIKIDIQDINDNSPVFPSDQIDIDISENAVPGTRFPLTSAHDPDAGENGLKTYQITRDDYNLFSLEVKSRGDGTKFPELVIQRPLDREERSHHTLILSATDGGEYPRSGTMQINVKVIDSNDNSPVFDQSSYVVEIPENSPPGKVLIDLNATDPDEGNNGQVVYSFSGYAPERIRELFSIDSRTGVIKIQGEIDYEESSVIEIDVQAKDLGPNPIPGHCKVTVKVLDRNDNWPSIGFVSVRQGAISEAAPPGTVIALVRVTDKDSGRNGQLQCRVLGNVPFKLEENYDNFYTVVTDRPLDREVQDEYNVTIVAKDNGSPPLNSTKSFTVKILDENDNVPRFTKSVYLLQIPENNIPGEYLGSVLAHDPDLGQNGTVYYSIINSNVSGGDVNTYVNVNAANGAIYAVRSFNYEQIKYFDFKVLAKDAGSPHLESNATVRISVLDVNDNIPVIVLPLLQNDTAEIHVPRNVGVGYIVTTVRAVDNDYGESGRLTYEISDGNEEHLFEIDPVTGEVRTAHPFWDDVSPIVELIIRVSDHGKPTLTAAARLIVKASNGRPPDGLPHMKDNQNWDMSLPLIVTLSIISIMLLAAMVTIAIKCKRENKEIRTYNCRIAEYSHPQLGKGKKKKINKNDIMLVQSEVEERDAMNVMNVVSSPSLATSPMYFDYQTRLPLSSPRSEVMYLKPTANNLSVPQSHVGCHTSFTGPVTSTTDTPTNRMSIIQTDNFPAEPNYMGSRQQFVQSSSTFKDPERASLRDSGHGDSDQADSDQDTNKGSCCDMSAKEALKLKAAGVKPPPLEQDEDCLNCTEECRVLGHSDRCWMPQFPAGGNQAEGVDYRNNMFVPAGMEAVAETETYETVNPNGKKTFCTFGKERRDHTILVANVKPYLKAKRALSPLLQEVPSASSSPTKGCSTMPPCSAVKGPADGAEGKPPPASCSIHYGPPDGQYLSPTKQTRDQGVYPSLPPSDPVAKVLAEARSRISQEAAGEMECVLEQAEPDSSRDGMDADQVVRDIDKLLQDCRESEATGTLRK
ncbi:protocadherin-17 isoform X1 [Poecilia formosa]|uniref:Protocadherin 17 n=1 Tax=Poecilia formosa TaxID=48698 RepID=A0A087Y0D1_POEFO|nr:PREDICTED: protocadherin-17 isoform X1 [Poecilia formosa]XP_016527887.1 PREDICTED: protocadherin-17 isoform X1 [Poecilia formosa]XP_016527888.1 PREDICTED: protocadherin-17 isoform X1 [Poecilia formosa]